MTLANLKIRRAFPHEPVPIELLLLADPDETMLANYLREGELFMAFLSDEVTGAYVLKSLSSDTVEIKNSTVAKSWQSRGIGQALLQDAKREAAFQGYKYLLIGTADASLRQLKIYQQFGFQIFEIKKNFFIDNYPMPIMEDGVQCRDMIMLRLNIGCRQD